ncbi:hypothetical protein [Providencia rettgeri]|uniref:hypothetical protein n=1 Tax=Providencia rettgeri TaxID=587 RepID=UPI00300F8F9C
MKKASGQAVINTVCNEYYSRRNQKGFSGVFTLAGINELLRQNGYRSITDSELFDIVDNDPNMELRVFGIGFSSQGKHVSAVQCVPIY